MIATPSFGMIDAAHKGANTSPRFKLPSPVPKCILPGVTRWSLE
jgi:hypothetical protein